MASQITREFSRMFRRSISVFLGKGLKEHFLNSCLRAQGKIRCVTRNTLLAYLRVEGPCLGCDTKFHTHTPRHQMGVGGQHHAPAALPPGKAGTHCTGGWVGLGAGLGKCGKSRPQRDSISGPSSPQQVVIPTTLSRLLIQRHIVINVKTSLCKVPVILVEF